VDLDQFGLAACTPACHCGRRAADARKPVFLPTDPPADEEASGRVTATLRRVPVLVEVYGWDEAFLGFTGDDPEALAAEIQRAVVGEVGLSCSIGIGHNKNQAKVAVRFAKPGGIYRLTEENWPAVMAARPARELWGVGRRRGTWSSWVCTRLPR